MEVPYKLALVPGCELQQVSPNEILIKNPRTPLMIADPSEGILTGLRMLAAGGTTEAELVHTVIELDGMEAVSRFYLHYLQLWELRLLSWSLVVEGDTLATLVPISVEYSYERELLEPLQPYVLSRFVYVHREERDLAIESPLSHAKVILSGPAAALQVVSALTRPCAQTDAALQVAGLPATGIEGLFELLYLANFLTRRGTNGETSEEADRALEQWDFHDLLFHARSRKGRHANPYGGVYPFAGRFDPLPAVKPAVTDGAIDLFRPDIEYLMEKDLTLTRALETRRSLRRHGHPPVTLQEVGEFLYRSSRIQQVVKRDGQEIAERVFPGGGAAYELEIYLAIHACGDCDRGLYTYLPLTHQIRKITSMNTDIRVLLESAAVTAKTEVPQILIVLSARFQRISYKYSSMAYASVLKNVGVLLQTMYLVATSMNLAGCALGGGNSDVFARAAGLRYEEETSVGEFILGRKENEEVPNGAPDSFAE